MNSLARLLGYAVLLLLVFLAAALGAQSWLHRQTQRLRAEAVEQRRHQFATAVTLTHTADTPWTSTALNNLGQLIGGTVIILTDPSTPSETNPAQLSFDERLSPDRTPAPLIARVTFPVPPTSRLLLLHQRTVVALLMLALVLLAVLAVLAIGWYRRRESESGGTRSPWATTRREMGSLTELAKTTFERGEELSRERTVRQRTEQELLLHQRLLNQSLEEKIRLGRDLHDGIIQSLYAAGLMLESSKSLLHTDPAEAERRIAQTITALNASIRDVRGYITGLAPENLRQAGFAQALDSLLADLRAGREAEFDLRLDETATALLTPEQAAETLQIVGEAVSNALRHGGASRLTLRVHQSDHEVCVLVQDNGTGFDATRRRAGGHGLGNMHARAERVGATVRVTSQPGEGTRVVLTLPATPRTSIAT